MIKDVVIKPLKIIPDERGAVLKMQQSSDGDFKGFGEIYFSTIYPGVIKGWHWHEETYLNYAVIRGMIKLVLYDDRNASPTLGEVQEIYIGEKNYCLVQIPPRVWNGFINIGTVEAVVADLTNLTHEQDKVKRLDPHNNDLIKYDWNKGDS